MCKPLPVPWHSSIWSWDPECPGVLRQQNGNATFASFGDYFAMELYARLLNEPILAW